MGYVPAVFGVYDWNNEEFVGRIEGRLYRIWSDEPTDAGALRRHELEPPQSPDAIVDALIVFEWWWTLSEERGKGYFRVKNNGQEIVGGWYPSDLNMDIHEALDKKHGPLLN